MVARVKVRLFHELLSSVGQSEIELEADTLAGAVQSLIQMHVNIKDVLYDAHGHPRRNILFYVNSEVQNPPDFSRKLNDGDLILLVPPAAGG
jgi:molybdopterin converting factor small subunit